MKKFSQYLTPTEPTKELSLTEKIWQEAKQKTEERERLLEEQRQREQAELEEQERNSVVLKIKAINEIVEERVDETPIIQEEVEPEPIVEEYTPIIEQVVVQGEPGPRGEKGDKGDKGEPGKDGQDGGRGDIGPRGDKGDQGEKGDKGDKGDKGEPGKDGSNGRDGKDGAKGDKGDRGEKGDKGDKGSDGRDGKDGIDGKDGAKGDKGDRGEKGDKGDKGDRGADGRDGKDGEKGDRGYLGERGPKGDKGDKGDTGATPDITPLFDKFNKLSLDINKKVGRIVGDMGALAGGGGSGSYWLNDLGDTDFSGIVNATNGQVLTYNEAMKKWTASDITVSGAVGTLQQVTAAGNTTTLGITTAAVQLNLTSAVTVSQGQMAWNPEDLTVDVGMANGVTLQLGQEQYIKVKAAENISDGQTVMFAGADGEHILAARCNTAVAGFRPEWFIGVATQDLSRNGFGYITTFGKVHNLNTLAFTEGDILYVDANNVGALVNTAPTMPRQQITVAAVTKRAGGDGHIMVRPSFESQLVLDTHQLTDAAFTKANSANVLAQAAFDKANVVNTYAYSAYSQANSATTIAQAAFNYANTIVSDTQIDPWARTQANSAFNKANSASITAQAAFDYANTIVSDTQIDPFARNQANGAFDFANTINVKVDSAYAFANTVNIKTDAAFAFANTINVKTDSAYAWANTINIKTDAAFTQANAATTTGQAAFDKANSANVLAQNAYNFANTVNTYAYSAYAFSNTVNTYAYSTNSLATTANNTATAALSLATSANSYAYSTNVVAVAAQSLASTANTKAQAAFDYANTSITTSGGSITGRLNVTYQPATTVNTAVTITAANTLGGTGYSDVFKLVNASGGATNPNKHLRISQSGALEIINSAYTGRIIEFTDSGDVNISGNVTGGGVKTGYSSARPGFRVYGSGTTNNLGTTVNTHGALTANNYATDFNQGSYLNTTSGVFTAPVAGLYQVNLIARNAGNAAYSQLAVVKNASGGNGAGGSVAIMIEFAGNSTMNHTGGSTVLQLAAGDTLACKVLAGTINFDSNDNWSLAYIG